MLKLNFCKGGASIFFSPHKQAKTVRATLCRNVPKIGQFFGHLVLTMFSIMPFARLSRLQISERTVWCISPLKYRHHYADFNAFPSFPGPLKRQVTSRVVEEKSGEFRIEFTPNDVGSHLVDATIGGNKVTGGPLVAKAYNSSLIRVTDVGSGVVGQPCQFKGKLRPKKLAATVV